MRFNIFWGSTIFGSQQNLWSENLGGHQKFWVNNFQGSTFFGEKEIFGGQHFWGVTKFEGVNKNLGLKQFWGQQNLVVKHFF